MSDLKKVYGVEMNDAQTKWADSLVGRVFNDSHAHFSGKVVRWEPAKKQNTGVWVFTTTQPEPRTFVKYPMGLGLNESFGPKPPNKSGQIGNNLPLILGMNSFYDTGKPAKEETIRMLADMIYRVKRSTIDQFVELWRQGEKKQQELSGSSGTST